MNQFAKCFLALVVFDACIGGTFADDDTRVKSILDQLPSGLVDNLPDLSSVDLPPGFPIDLVEPGQEAYAAACWAVATSAGFDPLNIDRYKEWTNNETTVQTPISGSYVGAKDVAEYVMFASGRSPLLDYFEFTDFQVLPLSFTEDGCEIFSAVKNKHQLTKKYANGEELCMEFMTGLYISFTIDIVKHLNPLIDDSGLLLKQINPVFPDNFPVFTLWRGDALTDYVCNDVLRDSCPEVYEANGLDEESCKATFEALPAAGDNNHADNNSRGCRILHSVFAETNKQHCPHLSFLPMEDEKGKIKCQEPSGLTKEDLFTPEQLEFYRTTGINYGFSPDEFWSYCDYVDPETAAEEPAIEEPPAAEEPAAEDTDESAAASTGTSISFLLLMLFACVIS